ncbi:partitioning defective 3 homolog isoform X3 [Anthonomus grandis grandis]|uniref:partitioning defective 3 homolog isoform X3 n=1 Tax=Anthonomus grandis grandis TaxID=2921223 RepID=UPI002166218D|nr:partitioning defective 3 homolog isoform X3 [Anthonomus grandis grandis]
MFDSCQTISGAPKCSDVAEKIVQLFGWRQQSYNVEKLQRNVPGRSTTRISITRTKNKREDGKKNPDAWVSVHNLQSQGGGILDPDDRLNDVADDREQILASFEDGDGSHIHHGGGDGASGSSVGTGSPDLFHDGEHKYGPSYPRTDIEVTGEQIASGGVPSLQVRRGSEPTLNQLPAGGPPAPPDHTKRWSAAPLILEPPSSGYASPRDWLEDCREEDHSAAAGFKRMARDGSNRLSMQFLGEGGGGYRWAEAAERAATKTHTSTSLPRESRRKEPLGQANNSSSSPTPVWGVGEKSDLVVIRNQPGPLGIHVVPDYDGTGKDRGLLVQGIEPGGRIDRDGRLAIYDRIVEINGQNLINIPFQRVQEIFKMSLTSQELRLKVVKASGLESLRKPPPPVYPNYQENHGIMVECEQKQGTNTKVATVSPTKKIPAISKNLKGLLTANTRKIGRKIDIELIKGPRGLGFSITTRDNPAGGNCPIYIKNIIPEGAAVEDGRLKIGDRLLQVNDEEMTGKSQSEAVAILRKVPPGSKVKIVVSRQEDVPVGTNGLPRVIGIEETDEHEDTPPPVAAEVPPNIPPLPPSHLLRTPEKQSGSSVAKIISQFQEASANVNNPPEKMDNNGMMVFPWKHREILTFDIPVHDSEKAGLGISVKGKTSEAGDLGIFIKSVINGGAASRDKRLKTNDQLLNVNGISLLQQSNSDAMETLRKAMLHTEGPVPGNITLTIARRASSPGSSRNRSNESLLNMSQSSQELLYNSQENSNEPSSNRSGDNSNSNASNGSTNTVIYNPNHPSNGTINHPHQQPMSPMHTWNPVLERLTGKPQLRNESYYKATHDTTWNNNSSFGNHVVVNMSNGEPVLIEDDYGGSARMVPLQHQSQINVHITNNSNNAPESRKDHEPDGKASLNDKTSSSQSTINATDATYASQLSLENPQGFSRDAFGRQSMSEKRHATLDAKSTDTYQKTKKMREERIKKESNIVRVGSVESVISVNRSSEHPEYADKLTELGPSLGMKKSSSLESLQTMVQEIQMQEESDPAYSYRISSSGLKVIRGKGCEESLRAAVADPNHRSEIGAKKHWLLDGPVEEREIDGFSNARGAPRQSSLNAALDNKNKPGKKKPGIFKGIGSMFRFGKHRKVDSGEPVQQYSQKTEFDANANVSQYSHGSQNEDNQSHHSQGSHNTDAGQQKLNSQVEKPQQDTNQQQPQGYHQQQQQQREQHIQREPIYQRHGYRHVEPVQVIPENAVAPPPAVKYRQNSDPRRNEIGRQRMGVQRHTYYQQSDDIYGRHQPQQSARTEPQYGEFGRPGSRSGITESPTVPFTHYVNYSELQTHMSRKDALSDSQIVQMRLQVQQQRLKVEEESRKQHQYHSQRQPRPDNQLRPISNYYEYESVQSVLNNRQVHVVRQQNQNVHQNPYDVNSNPQGRQQNRQQTAGHRVNSGQQMGRAGGHRGPFITQVTIGEHQKNGTKV